MDPITLIPLAIEWLPTCIKVLKNTEIPKTLADSAKDYVELLSEVFGKSRNSKNSFDEVAKNPDNAKELGKLELHLEHFLKDDADLTQKIAASIQKLDEFKFTSNIKNSKNVVNNSTLNSGGSINIGDTTHR